MIRSALAAGKKRSRPRHLLSGIVSLFFLAAFLLLFIREPSVQTALMMVAVPCALWAAATLLPRLFPMDRLLLELIGFLCGLGVLLQYRYTPSRGLAQCLNCGAGYVAMIVCALAVRHIRNWKLLMLPIIAGCVGMMALPFVFRAANKGLGATAWVAFGSFNMQPSEIVKIAYLFVLAYFLSRRKVLLSMIYMAAMLGILVLQRDLGTAAIYGGTALVLLYASTGSFLLIAGILGAGLGAVSVLYALFRNSFFLTVQNRINNWLNPFATYNQPGGGYQIVQGLIAMANGGLWGTGVGLGNADVIPEFRNDFIFSALMNEYGFLFALIIVCIYILIVLRCADIGLRSSSAFHALLSMGSGAMLAVQAFIIIGGVTKFIPMTGVTVPFLSYGGTSLVSCMGVLGIAQGVASRNERILREDSRIAQGEESL
ncbi:MAG: FtsW/RodA/SpoVE family cell cycle protein [Clostridia bacterium]|nr:FtsW/RodA/SpoVE family cell cycle protein [Clostridia bacterium]